MCTKPLQSCPTLCDAMDCSPPGSSVHGILQVRVLEWVAVSFSTERKTSLTKYQHFHALRVGSINTQQLFATGMVVAPRGKWPCQEVFLVVTTGGLLLASHGWRPGMLLNTYNIQDRPPPQRIISAPPPPRPADQIAAIPKSKSPSLE